MAKYVRSDKLRKVFGGRSEKPKPTSKKRPRHIWYSWWTREFRRRRNYTTTEDVNSFHKLNGINLCVKVSNNKLTVDAMSTPDHFGNKDNFGINKNVHGANDFYRKINKKANMVKPSQ